MLAKQKRNRFGRKKKRILYVEAISCRNVSHKTITTFSREMVQGNLGQCPFQSYLEKYIGPAVE